MTDVILDEVIDTTDGGFLTVIDLDVLMRIEEDLNRVRDKLPEEDRANFDSERTIHKSNILQYINQHGKYPDIVRAEKK